MKRKKNAFGFNGVPWSVCCSFVRAAPPEALDPSIRVQRAAAASFLRLWRWLSPLDLIAACPQLQKGSGSSLRDPSSLGAFQGHSFKPACPQGGPKSPPVCACRTPRIQSPGSEPVFAFPEVCSHCQIPRAMSGGGSPWLTAPGGPGADAGLSLECPWSAVYVDTAPAPCLSCFLF